ncbi:uncharacterized protein HHUB_4341 (plasmid) [Halobacterium hubeiense]|uniref:DUF4184 family protein n=1 Tax=Halobacterium hubeiense TaxID=1407499 RepID=A0A0U5H817_9EURY|nr:DUF4184 family protein [Halobacterium hubeiense]CQH64270.1 uncharacterized protein HHUB_4341 [Halobacterium hubeiense]
MPFTPFHLGPPLLLGVILYKWLDLPALLVGSVIIDVRAALVVFGPLKPPIHGILTTFIGGTIIASLLAAAFSVLPSSIEDLLVRLRLTENTSSRAILAGSLIGVYSHVILDSILYTDARPFSPIAWNPFFVDGVRFIPVYAGCTLAGILGLLALAVKCRSKP